MIQFFIITTVSLFIYHFSHQIQCGKNGAGIYAESSAVRFNKDSDVAFINNLADQNGSAIFLSSYFYIAFISQECNLIIIKLLMVLFVTGSAKTLHVCVQILTYF